jgi:hypothetical protein
LKTSGKPRQNTSNYLRINQALKIPFNLLPLLRLNAKISGFSWNFQKKRAEKVFCRRRKKKLKNLN